MTLKTRWFVLGTSQSHQRKIDKEEEEEQKERCGLGWD